MTNWIWKELGTISLLESDTENGVIIVDVRDLRDGKGNDVEKIKKKIQLIANLLSIGEKVTVRCVGGISRSNTIACAVMVYMLDRYSWEEPWATQWNKVRKKVPRAQENLDFIKEVKEALKELGRAV